MLAKKTQKAWFVEIVTSWEPLCNMSSYQQSSVWPPLLRLAQDLKSVKYKVKKRRQELNPNCFTVDQSIAASSPSHMKIFSLSYFQILANVLEPVLHFQFLAKHALLDHHVINLVRQNSYTCVLILVLSAATVSRLHIYSPGRYDWINHFFIESGQEMIQG